MNNNSLACSVVVNGKPYIYVFQGNKITIVDVTNNVVSMAAATLPYKLECCEYPPNRSWLDILIWVVILFFIWSHFFK